MIQKGIKNKMDINFGSMTSRFAVDIDFEFDNAKISESYNPNDCVDLINVMTEAINNLSFYINKARSEEIAKLKNEVAANG